MRFRGTLFFFLVTLITIPSRARAQAAAPAAAAPVVAGFQDGFFVQSADGANRVVLGVVGQIDGRFSINDPPQIVNTFTIRKMRPTVTGRVARYFDFKVMPDFGGGTAVLQDAYVDLRFSQAFRLRTGKDKTPIGYELLMGDAYVLFPERSLASSLVPNRDIGVQAQGDLAHGRVFYAGGVFNGVPDGASSSTDVDTNGGKDLAGRLVVQPFHSARAGRAARGLGFQIAGSRGNESGAVPSFKTSIGQTWFSYDRTVVADGRRSRLTPALFYYYKALGAFAEYMRSTQTVARTSTVSAIANHAFDVTTFYTLTGEAASDRGIRPANAFDPSTGAWGALQLLARYSELTVDRRAFDGGFAAVDAGRRARQYSVGLNWYPAAFVKYYVNFERTTFDTGYVVAGAVTRRPENGLIVRAQLAF
jgi:phosphate-selective porin OprO/OprP